MNTFNDIAYQILQEQNKPLHSNQITKIALEKGWLKTAGKTPEATMNAQLVVDINRNGSDSRFVKTSPSTFFINTEKSQTKELPEEKQERKKQAVLSKVSTKQKGGRS